VSIGGEDASQVRDGLEELADGVLLLLHDRSSGGLGLVGQDEQSSLVNVVELVSLTRDDVGLFDRETPLDRLANVGREALEVETIALVLGEASLPDEPGAVGNKATEVPP
jgi:hypothetical protein